MNENIIKCKICGYEGKNITKHIINKHNISIKDYKIKYNAEVECNVSKRLRVNNRHNTIKEKYGVDNISQLPYIKEKAKNTYQNTIKEKYNVNNVMEIPSIKEKSITNRNNTLLNKYNTINIMEVPYIKEKMRNSIQALWDNENSIYHSNNYGKFSHIIPNNTEQKIIDLHINNLKYTGNFAFWVTFKNNRRKNPDFIIEPFKEIKKVIEIFGGLNFYHFNEEAKELIKLYNEINIQCLIIWDYEINTANKLKVIYNRIMDFINS